MEISAAGIDEAQLISDGRCSDSRDRGSIESTVADHVSGLYKEAGILVLRESVLSAGTFATRNFIYSLMSEIRNNKNALMSMMPVWATGGEVPEGYLPLRTIIRMTTHTDVSPKEGVPEGKIVYGKQELSITMGTPIGCGMEGANGVWKEIMGFLKGNLTVRLRGSDVPVSDYEVVLDMLREYYGFDGENPLRFIKSIEDHRMHVTEQARKVESAIREDFQLRRCMVDVLQGIVNYRTGRVYRVDNMGGLWTAHDDISAATAEILALLPDDHPEKVRRTVKQEPKAMLICPPGVQHPRKMLGAHLNAIGEMAEHVGAPGSVFTISGHDVLGDTYCFGPYDIVGIFYAAAHLKIRNLYLVGENEAELGLMETKIRNDPIVSLILKKFGVGITKITVGEAMKATRESIAPSDKSLQEAVGEGIKVFTRKLHKESPLNRLPKQKLNAEVCLLKA